MEDLALAHVDGSLLRVVTRNHEISIEVSPQLAQVLAAAEAGKRDASPMYTMVYAVYSRDDISREEFVRHLTEVHSQIGRRLPGIRRYEQFPIESAEGHDGDQPGAFALAEYDSEEAWQAAVESDVMKEVGEDAAKFASKFATFVVDANKVI
jgi:uncharacterized protein (TIGR02118 family)